MVALPFTFFTSRKITVAAPWIYEISLLVLRKNISRVSDLVSLSMHVIIYLQKMDPPLKECRFAFLALSFILLSSICRRWIRLEGSLGTNVVSNWGESACITVGEITHLSQRTIILLFPCQLTILSITLSQVTGSGKFL